MVYREFQNKTAEALRRDSSVLVHAPTGLGKTWATARPFVEALAASSSPPLLGTRLLHVLPVRALAGSVRDDLNKLLEARGLLKHEGDPRHDWRKTWAVIHHGQQQESNVFAERAGVTTIDQYLAGFSGAPLSFASSTGHAIAAATVASYSVFDEVHLLGPERGLPLLFALLKQRRRWGLLSAVMTATLPSSVRSYFREELGLEVVEASEADAQERDGWRKVTLRLEREPLSSEAVAERALEEQKAHGQVIVFVNTVDAAVELAARLEERLEERGPKVILAHSNFAPLDRRAVEGELTAAFGKHSTTEAILVTTQVAEAGLNVSAPVVLSELAPVDSLIQRAGRCARFRPESGELAGRLEVFVPEREKPHVPYLETLWTRTLEAFRARGGECALDWKAECALVDEVLDDYYARYVRSEPVSQAEVAELKKGKKIGHKTNGIVPAQALALFEQTFRTRNPGALEETLREITNVQVVVTDMPLGSGAEIVDGTRPARIRTFREWLAGQNALWPSQRDRLESVPVSFGRFRRAMVAHRLELHELYTDRNKQGELRPERNQKPLLVLSDQPVPLEEVRPNRTYVLEARRAGYSSLHGLTFEGIGSATPITEVEGRQRDGQARRPQTWLEHSRNVYLCADRVLGSYTPFLKRWGEKLFPETPELAENLANLIRVAALFHDVGKLNLDWQRQVGWKENEPFVGRTEKAADNRTPDPPLPPHGFHAFPALRWLFEAASVVDSSGRVERVAEYIALASARHHSVGSDSFGWRELEWNDATMPTIRALITDPAILAVSPRMADLGVLLETDDILRAVSHSDYTRLDKDERGNPYRYSLDTPTPGDDFYPVYAIANRVVKVADWEDAGGKRVELC